MIERDFTYKWRFPWHFYRKDVISWQFKLQKMVDLWRLNQQNRWSGMMAMNLWWFLWFLGVSARKRGIVMGFILWISLVSWHSYGIDDPFIEFSSNVYFFKILTQSPPGCQPFSLRGRRAQAPSDALSTMERVGPLIGWNQAKLKFLQMPPDQGCGGPRWGWDDLRWRCCTQQTANW